MLGLLALIAGPLAGNAQVDYVEGLVTVASGGDWAEVAIGDSLAAPGTVQLGVGGFLELSEGGARILLRREGLYDLGELLQQARVVNRTSVAELVTGKLRALGAAGRLRTEALGVRGEQQSSPGVVWADDASVTVEQAQELLAAGATGEALDLLHEALDFAADSQQESRLLYHIGYAYAQAGEPLAALDSLLASSPAVDVDYVGPYVLLTGRLLLETLELLEARLFFGSYLPHLRGTEETQVAFLLSALVHRGLGDPASAVVALQRARDLNPDNGAGQAAQELLDE